VRILGWFGIFEEYRKYFERTKKLPIPKIIAPIGAHFAIKKAAGILGFGQDNIEWYYLREVDGHPDPGSLKKTVENVLSAGNKIAMIWITFGDTERGILSNTDELVDSVRNIFKNEPHPPAFLVDAAAQYLFGAVSSRKDIPVWDFRVPEVKAIVVDPHKNQIPYPASILILRDQKDVGYSMMDEEYLSLESMSGKGMTMSEEELESSQIHATIPTTRTGYSPAATWAYYIGNGFKEIQRRKDQIWQLVSNLRNEIYDGQLSPYFKLVCEPDSALVAFQLRPEWLDKHEDVLTHVMEETEIGKFNGKKVLEAAKEFNARGLDTHPLNFLHIVIYERINQSPDDFLYIARSTSLGLTTKKKYDEKQRKADILKYELDMEVELVDYMGLMIHVMEHVGEDQIDLVVKRLEEEVLKLIV
ncbi:MAG: hypothetical protein IH859_06195, partial [Chloroflexi bacterium]|nr:hypothetical protein [Chloroflexota bacterium]